MRIEHLKRWQWAVIGLFVGIIAGWVWSSVEDSGLSDATTLGSQQLERLLSAKPLEGRPRIKRITVHEQDGRYTVWMKVLQPDPDDPHPKNPRHYRYASERLNPTTPFLPDFRESPTQSVMWRINPSALTKPPVSGKRVAEGALPLWINGAAVRGDVGRWMQLKDWKPGPEDGRDPGSGAEVSLALRPATYQLHVALSQAQDKPASAQDLAVTFNGSALPPNILLKNGSGTVLETTLPREAFIAGEDQVLRFSRKDRPVKIWEIRLIDPHYSIVDYLTYAEAQHPEIKFSKAWWDTAHARYLICTIGGVVFFGGIWPTIIRLLTGAQPDTGKDGEDYDLDRFKGESPKNETSSEPPPEVDTSQMEEELEKGAKPRVVVQDQSQVGSAPVPLSAEPLAPVPIADADHNSAEYKGEYYPVVRPAGDKHEGKKG